MEKTPTCHHCEGKGYTEIRDCGGEVQRTEHCSFCEGLGSLEIVTEEQELTPTNNVKYVERS